MNGIEHIKDNNNLAKNDLCVLKRENKKSSITKKPQGNIIWPTNRKKTMKDDNMVDISKKKILQPFSSTHSFWLFWLFC